MAHPAGLRRHRALRPKSKAERGDYRRQTPSASAWRPTRCSACRVRPPARGRPASPHRKPAPASGRLPRKVFPSHASRDWISPCLLPVRLCNLRRRLPPSAAAWETAESRPVRGFRASPAAPLEVGPGFPSSQSHLFPPPPV